MANLTNEEIYKVFLKENDVYEYFENHKFLGVSPAYNRTTSVRDAINISFIWTKTEQGQDFWEDLDNKWIELCGNFNLTNTINLEEV